MEIGGLFASPGSNSFSHSRGPQYCSTKWINTHPFSFYYRVVGRGMQRDVLDHEVYQTN